MLREGETFVSFSRLDEETGTVQALTYHSDIEARLSNMLDQWKHNVKADRLTCYSP